MPSCAATGKALCDVTCFDTASDPNNCGGCAANCPEVDHGARTCGAGQCGANLRSRLHRLRRRRLREHRDLGVALRRLRQHLRHGSGLLQKRLRRELQRADQVWRFVRRAADGRRALRRLWERLPCPGQRHADLQRRQVRHELRHRVHAVRLAVRRSESRSEPLRRMREALHRSRQRNGDVRGAACGFVCDTGFAKCGDKCVDVQNDSGNCGGCGNACQNGRALRRGGLRDELPGRHQAVRGGVRGHRDRSRATAARAARPARAWWTGAPAAAPASATTRAMRASRSATDSASTPPATRVTVAHAGAPVRPRRSAAAWPASPPSARRTAAEGCRSAESSASTNKPTSTTVARAATSVAPARCAPTEHARSVCPSETTNCGGQCVATDSDVLHCGGCGNACTAPPGAQAFCSAGQCGSNCTDGFIDCAGSCVDPTKLPNCGAVRQRLHARSAKRLPGVRVERLQLWVQRGLHQVRLPLCQHPDRQRQLRRVRDQVRRRQGVSGGAVRGGVHVAAGELRRALRGHADEPAALRQLRGPLPDPPEQHGDVHERRLWHPVRPALGELQRQRRRRV